MIDESFKEDLKGKNLVNENGEDYGKVVCYVFYLR